MTETSPQPDVQAGEQIVQQLYRLFKLAVFHDLKNEAVHRAIDQSVIVFRQLITKETEQVTVLFAGDTVFVDGQLLKGGKGIYDTAIELGEVLETASVNQIEMLPELQASDIRTALFAFVKKMKERSSAAGSGTFKFKLKRASSTILFGDDSDLDVEQQMAKTYAYSVVAMRRLFDGVKDGNYVFSRHVKRLAQRIAMVADEEASALLGLTSLRDANNDEAGRSVNSAVLAVSMARLLNRDLRFLSHVTLSAMLYNVGLPRAAGMGRPDPHRMTSAIPRLNEEQERTVPACSALVATALGRLTEESLHRTVVGFEAQWLNRIPLLGPLYREEAMPALESQLIAMVWRFTSLVSYDIWSHRQLTVDEAIFVLSRDARSDIERILIDMLLSSMCLFPRGTIVKLTSGWSAVVCHNPDFPALFSRPTVYLVVDPDGHPQIPREVDLYEAGRRGDDFGQIAHMMHVGGEALIAVQTQLLANTRAELPPSEFEAEVTTTPRTLESAPVEMALPPGTGVSEEHTVVESPAGEPEQPKPRAVPSMPSPLAMDAPKPAFLRKKIRQDENRGAQVTPQTLVASAEEMSPWDLASGLSLPRRDDFTRPAPRADLPIPPDTEDIDLPAKEPEKEQQGKSQFTYAKAGGESMKVPVTRPRQSQPLPEEKED